MPKIDIDMFDETPRVGDDVKVLGKVESIDEDSGEVDVSYDDVKIVDKKKRKKRRDNDDDDVFEDEVVLETQMEPNTQSLDQALAQQFPNSQ